MPNQSEDQTVSVNAQSGETNIERHRPGPGRPDIVDAGSDRRYSECRVRRDHIQMQGPGHRDHRPITENAGSGETRSIEGRVQGDQIQVKAGSGETRYSECRVRGDQL
ncbi:unnamed protein product [Staurois parvus]|uniref:Uncharacterized protein n=1 Tax=Staurois parvus TaxID=386267 RepID=A0ABN9HSF1_9NEOB|nr:unnamed protein product [Staurois parvus]